MQMQQYQNGPYGDTRIQQNNINDQSPYRNIAQQAQMAQQYNQQQMFQSPPPPQNQQMQTQTVSSMKYMQTPIQVYNNQVRTLQAAHTVIPHVHQYKVPHQPQPQQQQQLTSGREISQVRQTLETKQPEIHELYHVERELQVLSVEEVEIPWKRKCVELEIQIYDLQTELARYKNMAMGEKLTTSDDSQIQQYELRLRQQRDIEAELRAEINEQNNEIEQWRSRYQRLQQEFQSKSQSDDEIRSLRDTIVDRDRRILKLEEQLKQNDIDYQNLMRDTQALDQENVNLRNELTSMDQRMTTVTQTERMVVSLEGEVEMWKDRFKKSNTEYHKLQNQLTDAQAELDAIKNKRTVVTTEKVTTNQTNVQQNIRNSRYQPNSSQINRQQH